MERDLQGRGGRPPLAVKVIGAHPPRAAIGAGGRGGAAAPRRERRGRWSRGGGATDVLVSPIQGTVLKVR